MIAEFWTWWRQHLLELVPERYRASGSVDALVVDASLPTGVRLARRRRGQEALLGPRLDGVARPGEPVILRLGAEQVLERQVVLPLAAERDPERLLGYDMERLTPFAADEVYWGCAVESRDRALGRLVLRLALVPKAAVAALIEQMAASGVRPGLIEATTATGTRTIRLDHDDGGRRLITPPRVAIALAAFAGIVLISPLLRQSLEFSEAQARLDALAPRFQTVEALRARINGAGGGDAVAREAARLGDTLAALGAITEILPDDSYLTEFTMRERKMTLSGLSASAPKLISALSADARIRNPAFTAPVTRAENGHNDVFSIRADLANPAATGAAR